ncbi:RNA polymerase subunit sigma [Pedobacter miscanthi]|uniref:RNA polymerase subunit sigma n=2 Tax=Pedobacter miscanthi TaxID=2259170 RepID=A0A366L023_9SPHI|nr:RNA polymerase subunit sigma [Pedobacter miscanthi]
MDNQNKLLPQLFRNEFRKIVSVLTFRFGIVHIQAAEDIVSDTFLSASESWSIQGTPENPVAWLYSVAKNKARNYLSRNSVFENKVTPAYQLGLSGHLEAEIDLSEENINDSQLAMIFAVCNPEISEQSQVSLALNILCGFGIQEIADAFLTNKEVIYKRLKRGKEKLKEINLEVRYPSKPEIKQRIDGVLTTIYLLFSEGYYSNSQNNVLRMELCREAMRLNHLLIDSPLTNLPQANALLSLMCFHSSRFEARTGSDGEFILYADQDETRWNQKLIHQGSYFLEQAATGNDLSHFHLEAAIAYWHTKKEDSTEKWENILQLYNSLLIENYSPMAALNRTYALFKTSGKAAAILEAEKLTLHENHFYFLLLGDLYTGVNNVKAVENLEIAFRMTLSDSEQKMISKKLTLLRGMN